MRVTTYGAVTAMLLTLCATALLFGSDVDGDESARSTVPPAAGDVRDKTTKHPPNADLPQTALAGVRPTRSEHQSAGHRSRHEIVGRVEVAATLSPTYVEAGELRRYWAISADRGAPDAAIEALEQIARANTHRPAIALAALDYRDDLQQLRARAIDGVGGTDDESFAPEALGAAPDHAEPGNEPLDHDLIDLERLDELRHEVRYASDDAAFDSIRVLSHHREDIVVDTLLEATDHPDAHHRHKAITALWRSAADGVDSTERGRVRDRLAAARYDPDVRVALLAEQAIADLNELSLDADAGGIIVSPAEDCPPEDCGERAGLSSGA